jgi:hypothetical protein
VASSKPRAASPQAPSITSVVKARFAEAVDLDHGGLLIKPPPKRAPATVTEAEAEALFEATDAVEGPHDYAILGLGLVTVATSVEEPPPTTTTVPPGSTTAPTASAPPTTPSSTTLPSTTLPPTTTAPTAPATTIPTTTTTTLPTYSRRLAWVGIVWGASEDCSGSTTTAPATNGTTSYVAVVIDANSGHRVLAYRSGGTAPCTGAVQTPSVTEPDELLSVPWQPVGTSSTAVQISIPPCGSYYGWTQVPTAGGGSADQVVVAVPFDPTCATAVPQSYSVDQVVPLGSGQTLVGHAPVGPVQALQAQPAI